MLAARVHLGLRIGFVGLVAAAGLSLAGCADFARVTGITPTPIDTTSSVAAQVAAATRASYPQPSFRDVPPKPTDIRPAAGFKAAVAANDKARAEMDAWVATHPAMAPIDTQATEAFAAGQRARIPAGEMVPPAPPGTEDYAARLRDLATPPPPPK